MTEKKQKVEVSRRKFLGGAGLLGGAALGSGILAGCGGAQPAAAPAPAATAVPCPTCAPAPEPPACPTAAPVECEAAAAAPTGPVEITMIDPTGAQEVTALFADRLDTLDGKLICELGASDLKWQPHRTFPYLEEQLKAKYPTIEFIDFHEFNPGLDINSDEIAEAVKASGCDAAIVGNAG